MPTISVNKKARYDYLIQKIFEAGIELKGHEVKAVKKQGANLKGSFVKIIRDQAYAVNMDIPLYKKAGSVKDYDSKRSRRLLLHKREINEIIGALSRKGYSVIPLKMYTTYGKIKLAVGIGKSKKKHDKREELKRKQQILDIQRELKEKLRY